MFIFLSENVFSAGERGLHHPWGGEPPGDGHASYLQVDLTHPSRKLIELLAFDQ